MTHRRGLRAIPKIATREATAVVTGQKQKRDLHRSLAVKLKHHPAGRETVGRCGQTGPASGSIGDRDCTAAID
jgi:hypothetical protein